MSLHTVTIKAVPDADDFEYEIECPNSPECALWYECGPCENNYDPTEDENEAGEFTRHGRLHECIDGLWMTNTGKCALGSTDSGADGLFEIAIDKGAGTYQVHIGYWGDGVWDVTLDRGTANVA
jgi:hypothetical protein